MAEQIWIIIKSKHAFGQNIDDLTKYLESVTKPIDWMLFQMTVQKIILLDSDTFFNRKTSYTNYRKRMIKSGLSGK
jgi:hypothetical protein